MGCQSLLYLPKIEPAPGRGPAAHRSRPFPISRALASLGLGKGLRRRNGKVGRGQQGGEALQGDQ
jgi:hypothetical protein